MPKGPFIFVTKQGLVFGATSIEPTVDGVNVRLKGLQHSIKLVDIETIYSVDANHPAASIEPGILSTVTALERLLIEFAKGQKLPKITIFGSGSLALTLILKWTPKVGQRGTVHINQKVTVQHVQETTPA